MWIRSQDKEVLTKVIDIYKQADTNEIWAYSDKGIKNCLGFYATKERALEVLDEIQKYIENNLLFNFKSNGDCEILPRNEIYQIPKE